jgi:hypothetical protein
MGGSLYKTVLRGRDCPDHHPRTDQSNHSTLANPSRDQSSRDQPEPSLEPNSLIMLPLLFLLLSLLSPLRAFQLYHRILHPSLPDQSFFHRGTIDHGNARIEAAPSLQYDLLAFAETSAHVTDALYQLALDPHPGRSDSLWLVSTVKAVTIPFSLPLPVLLSHSTPPPPPFFFLSVSSSQS